MEPAMLASPLLKTEKISQRLARGHVWAFTLDAVVKLYIAERSSGLSNPKDKAQWQSTLVSYESPIIGKLTEETLKIIVHHGLEPVPDRRAVNNAQEGRDAISRAQEELEQQAATRKAKGWDMDF